jgi:hypothetical protein
MGTEGNATNSRIKLRFVYIIPLAVMFMTFLTGCFLSEPESEALPKGESKLSDAVYDPKIGENCVVYIKEIDEYVPYYILTSNYNNSNCSLLLRKHLLDEKISFNSEDMPAALYADSVLDKFLEEEFVKVFADDFRDKMQSVDIDTIKHDQLGKANPETTLIKRTVFALSYTELGFSKSSTEAVEGKALSFFENADSRIACLENGIAESWWTRTAHNWGGDQAIAVGHNGIIGNGATITPNSVRPAFCLPSDTKIVERQDIVEGKTVYSLE